MQKNKIFQKITTTKNNKAQKTKKINLIISLAILIAKSSQAQYYSGNQEANRANPLAISKSYKSQLPPPPSGLGQSVSQNVNIIQPSLPLLPPPSIKRRVNKAFTDFEESQLSKKQIRKLKEQNLENNEASTSPYIKAPKAITRTLMLDLSPGINAPTIKLASGSLSSIVFSSLNGDAWNIENISINKNMFSNGGNESQSTNVLNLEPLKPTARGNVIIMLKGLSTPVIFNLISGDKTVDYRVDVKVPGRNPDATTRINYEEKIPEIDNNVPYFLDGVPPAKAKKLKVTGNEIEAWELNDNMYIKTKADVQYPAYHSSARSTSGLAVYRFNQIYNTVTLLESGRAFTVMIEKE